MTDETTDDADTEEALAEFDFLMSEGKPMRPGASAGPGKLLVDKFDRSILAAQ